jgi:hypothetical protein
MATFYSDAEFKDLNSEILGEYAFNIIGKDN